MDMMKYLPTLSLILMPALVWSQSYLTNGGFESGLNSNWQHTTSSGAAATASLSQEGPREGANELKIDYTTASTDQYAVTSSTTVTVGSDSIYLLVFWARESKQFQYKTDAADYVANPDFAKMIVTVTGESGQKQDVLYALRQGMTTFHLPFKTHDKTLTISFHPQTAGRQYYIDDVRLLDQTRHDGLDILNTYIWNNKRSTTGPTWLAGDNDVSFRLPDGRTVWFFNDSFDGQPNDPASNIFTNRGGFIRNAIVIQDVDGTLTSKGSSDTDGKGQRAFFEIIPGNEVYNADGSQKNLYWVGDAIMEDNKVKVYLVEVEGLQRSAVAELSYPDLQLLDIKPQAEFCYGYETMFVENDTIFLYKKNEGSTERGAHVARTPVGNLTGAQMWEFWNGSSWVKDQSQSVSVLDNVMPDGVVKLQDDNYAMVSGMNALSRDMYFSFAPAPQGPWTTNKLVYTRPDDWMYWAYMPNIHGQLDNGNYSVSYSSNSWLPLFFSTWSFADKYWYLLGLSPYTTEETNVALNKPVTVSSTAAGSNIAANAVDGNSTTRWSSEYSDTQWIYVDLQATYDINKVKVTWETACAKDYQIQVSVDASTWTTIHDISGNSQLVNTFGDLTATGRYVRIYGTSRATIWGYSIFELAVYGDSVPTRIGHVDGNMSRTTVSIQTNPVNGMLRVIGADKNPSYEIYSISGKKLLGGKGTTVNVSRFAPGVYVITGKDKTGNFRQKFVLQ
jgi:hypothetical protein